MDRRLESFTDSFMRKFRAEFSNNDTSFSAPQTVLVQKPLGKRRPDPSPLNPPGSQTGLEEDREEPA